ncbi:hypothetical protein SE23_17690 [Vibrio sinaloensis]|nr:hypothetical protein SE23_17690 [Vibrio sinaloensis]
MTVKARASINLPLPHFEPVKLAHQPAPKMNEATHELWHVLRLEGFKNLSRQRLIADLEKRVVKEN